MGGAKKTGKQQQQTTRKQLNGLGVGQLRVLRSERGLVSVGSYWLTGVLIELSPAHALGCDKR